MFAPPLTAASIEQSTSPLCFPNEFPYEFAFTSPEDSTETEDETNDDEDDDFLAALTRRLALFTQRLPKVNSAESTLSQLGSSGNKSPNGPFSQAPSPPQSPVTEQEVSKTKATDFNAKPNSHPNPKPSSFVPFTQNAAFYDYPYYYYYYWLRQPQHGLVAYPYPVFAAPNAVKQPCTCTSVLAGSTAVKPPSVGTGVFLPRSYTNRSGSRKKGGSGCVQFPTKVVKTQTEKLSGRIQSRRLAAGHSKIDRGTKAAVTGGCLKAERHFHKNGCTDFK